MNGAPFADIAVALKTQAGVLAAQASELERIAIDIGLSPGAIDRMVFPARRQAELIGRAHYIIKALAEAA